MKTLIGLAGVALAVFLARAPRTEGSQEAAEQVLARDLVHLGDSDKPDWGERRKPTATTFEVTFRAQKNSRTSVFSISSADVSDDWSIVLNGKVVGSLAREAAFGPHLYEIAPGALADGENALVVRSADVKDDILIGDVRLMQGSIREIKRLGSIEVRVIDAKTRTPMPARVTFLDEKGAPIDLWFAVSPATAVRKGVAYMKDGAAKVEVSAGRITVIATRGMEWSLAQKDVELALGDAARIELALEREVDTTGYLAVDTHVHTLTYSGHGDSSVEERQMTLAGEGVEIAVATDHNHHTDYAAAQRALGLERYYTAVTGNEVTTDVGHFNGFPLAPTTAIPDYKLAEWSKIVDGIRAQGAQVVILNHPRWPKPETGPFARQALDHATGAITGQSINFDATELANSQDLKDDPMMLFRDWFALMNGGTKIAAVGSSDSHTVGDPVGQGRTYVPSASDDPVAADVDAACTAIRTGTTSIALGLFTTIRVNRASTSGDVVTRASGGRVDVAVRVACARWFSPRELVLFQNGTEVARKPLTPRDDHSFDVTTSFALEWPDRDAWLVAVALGDGVSGAWWPTMKDYTLGATNPVYLDGDGDGEWSSPRATARRLVDDWTGSPSALAALVRSTDDAIANQVIDSARLRDTWNPAVADAAREALRDRPAVAAFLERVTAADAPARIERP